MKNIIVTILLVVTLVGAGWGSTLPSAPTPHPVERDPGAWAFTTGFTAAGVGIWKPWVGLAAGSAVAIFGNGLQNSHNAHVDMLGGLAGAAAGYLIIKTLKHDWHGKK